MEKSGFVKLIGIDGILIPQTMFWNMIAKDLSNPIDLYIKGNVLSLEVFEHIPPQYSNIFLNNITSHCNDILIMSAAIPNQGGNGHVNEVENSYIIERVTNRGFEYLIEDTLSIREVVENHCCYFRKSLLIFKKIKD